jgi:hypothetical protein
MKFLSPVRFPMVLVHFAGLHGAVPLAIVAASISVAGCNRGPVPVRIPRVDPAAASQGAVELYDTNGDGQLSKQELTACPGILRNLSIYDADSNNSVTQGEIETRLHNFFPPNVGVTKLSVHVSLDGRSLAGATVKFIPEAYLGGDIKPAGGITTDRGNATIDIRDQDAPESEHGLSGIHFGTYKVQVTHPTLPIPAKYNTETTLGYETQRGNPSFEFDLESR